MTPAEDRAFTEFLREKALEAQQLGYKPAQFQKMLGADGGYRTVSMLLAKRTPSEGFVELWTLGRLDLSVEALVVETRWRRHFDDELLRRGEKRLADADFKFTRFESSQAETSQGSPNKSPPEMSLPRKRNSQSFSDFCARLGAPLRNPADRWCGISEERKLAVFTAWADHLKRGRYLYWDDEADGNDTRIGARELHRVIETVMAGDYSAYGILCEAVDPSAATRKRGYFVEDTLLVLRFSRESPGIVAYVEGEVAASDVIAGRRPTLGPFDSAEDDIGAPPSGSSNPERTSHVVGGYRRDIAVRDFVLRRSGGRCEYCGVLGFELTDGSHYVEAHHVLALSASGPDTVANVIALCAHHHREAHYGRNAAALEAEFLAKLRALCHVC